MMANSRFPVALWTRLLKRKTFITVFVCLIILLWISNKDTFRENSPNHVIKEKDPKYISSNRETDATPMAQLPTELSQDIPSTDGKNVNRRKSTIADKKTKTILLWNKYFKDPTFGMKAYGTQPFTRRRCPATCVLTHNVSRLAEADAVVFHMRNNFYPFPTRQNEQQLFVFYLHESPENSFYNKKTSLLEDLLSVFNVTMTYRYDSDIPMPTCAEFSPKTQPSNYRFRVPFKNKTRNVVWMASNCHTPGGRELYIKALAKYIDVDIYGKCGNLSCPRTLKKGCQQMYEKKYKFFVAAENSMCRDYVSEKINRGVDSEMIPIVYGGLDYATHMPPNSVIDITKYESPKHLADYLLHLSSNEEEYAKYFDWRWKYRRRGVTKPMGMCKLCQILNEGRYHKIYPNISKWWTEGTCNTQFIDNLIKKGLVKRSIT